MLNSYTAMAIMLIVMMIIVFGMFGYMFYIAIHDQIEDYKKDNKRKLNRVRRDQLIKEMKAGTFDEKKARDMIDELFEVIDESSYIHHYRKTVEMTKRHSGIIQLTTLLVDGHSWI